MGTRALPGREVRALSAFDGSLASTPISPTRAFAAITLPVRGLQKEDGKQWLRYYSFDIYTGDFVQLADDGKEISDNIEPYIYLADLNGDGLSELIRAVKGSGSDKYWMYRANHNGVLASYAMLGPPGANGSTTPMQAFNTYNNFAGGLDGSGRSTLLVMGGLADVDTRYKSVTLSPKSSNGIVVESSTVPWIARNHYAGMGKVLLDLNGDGLLDAVEYPTGGGNHSSTSFINLGQGMLGGSPNFTDPTPDNYRIYSDNAGHDILFGMDVNQDGRVDLVSAPYYYPAGGIPSEGQPINVFISNGQTLSAPTYLYRSQKDGGGTINWTKNTQGKSFRAFDANGDGLTDFTLEGTDVGPVRVYLHDGKKADMITAFHGGHGATTVVNYTAWSSGSDVSIAGCGYPVLCPKRGLWVVSDYHVDPGKGQTALPRQDYGFEGAAFDALGRGWLGFQKQVIQETSAGRAASIEYENTTRIGTSYPFTRLPHAVTDSVHLENGGVLYGYTVTTYGVVNGTASPSGQSFAVAPTDSTQEDYETPSGGTQKALRSLHRILAYDARGNPKKSEQYGLLTSTYDSVEQTCLNDTANWILSPVTSRKQTSTADRESLTRTQTFDYDSTVPRLLNKVTVEPDADVSKHLEVKVTQRSSFGLATAFDAYDLAGTHHTGSVEYDDMEGSRISLATNAAGHTSRAVYHMGLGIPIWQRDANGLETNTYYYPFGRLQSVAFADGNRKTMTYTAPALSSEGVLKVQTTLASGQRSSQTTDSIGRTTVGRRLGMNGKVAVQKVTYDPIHPGSVAGASVAKFEGDPAGDQYTRVTYDRAGRVLTVRTPDGRTVSQEYSGRKTTTTDAKGNVSYVVSDELGRVATSVHSMPASDDNGARDIPITYTFGPFGALRTIVDANQNATETQYDNLGRVSLTTDPDRGTRIFTYDAFGNLLTQVALGGTTTFTPDVLGRNTKIVSPDGTATFTWDTALHGIGQLAASTSEDGVSKSLSYDALSRVTSEAWTIDGESYTVGLSYDSVGRPDVVTYPNVPNFSDVRTKNGYAANGDLSALIFPSDHPKSLWKVNERDEVGRIKTEELGDGSTVTYGIDQVKGVITGISALVGTSVLQASEYTYDENLNVKTRSDSVVGIAERFEYDAIDRLHRWSETGSYGWAVTYGHDDIGNLTSRSLAGPGGESEALTFEHSGASGGPHAITNSAWGSYGYDGRGNMTSSPEGTIDYTWFNLPKRITGAQTTSFKYDAAGGRVQKQSNGATGTTVYAGGLYERRAVAGSKTHIFYLMAGGRAIGQLVRKESDHSDNLLYIHTDTLGSSEIVTDSAGNLVGQRRKADPFGAPTNMLLPKAFPGVPLMSGDVHLGFTGHEEDAETGLINMKGRIYNPRVGHFLTPDPLLSSPAHPAGLNPYAYVLNNPLNYTDPSGFEQCSGSCSFDGENVNVDYGQPKPNPFGGEDAAGWGGGGGGGGGMNDRRVLDADWWDPAHWFFPNNPWVYPIEQLHDGKLAMRLPGGGWMREDSPGTVFFATRDGRGGAMSLRNYRDNYMYSYSYSSGGPPDAHDEQVRYNLGEISDNPIIDFSPPAPPMAVGGQSVPMGVGTQHGGGLRGFTSGVYPTVFGSAGGAQLPAPRQTGESWLHYALRELLYGLSNPAIGVLPLPPVASVATKAINLPRWTKVAIDWTHILERHIPGGIYWLPARICGLSGSGARAGGAAAAWMVSRSTASPACAPLVGALTGRLRERRCLDRHRRACQRLFSDTGIVAGDETTTSTPSCKLRPS